MGIFCPFFASIASFYRGKVDSTFFKIISYMPKNAYQRKKGKKRSFFIISLDLLVVVV